MHSEYNPCRLCPRDCGIDRTIRTGACRVGSALQVSRASLHMWEEPCISGTTGSGTVFFSGCSLSCVYCQNQVISRGQVGKKITPERLVEIFFELEEQKANNINLVTGDHYLPTIRKPIQSAKDQGLRIPFLLNTSSYIRVDTLKEMEGLIDLYLPDLKYIRPEDAARYSHTPDYPEAAKAAIAEMVRQQPKCILSGDIMQKGVVVRHMPLPGMIIQGKLIVKYLYETYGDRIYISLLRQFTPNDGLLKDNYPEINRPLTEHEYKSLVDFARDLGITNGFVQEGEAIGESFIPEFDCRGV